ncbi:MAG: SpoIID/LytB domain-containing protein [Bacteroidales bacterium]
MLYRLLFVVFLTLYSVSLHALHLDIALFYSRDVTEVEFSSVSGEYRLKGDYDHLGIHRAGAVFKAVAIKNRIHIYKNDSLLGNYRAMAFRGESFMNSFRIDPKLLDIDPRIYDNDLKLIAQKGKLQIINHVELELYVAGVVQAEGGGSSKDVEFYQVQAITCRTYALNNHRKHLHEGFHLCDGVHCQVYKGKAVNSNILLATMRTSGEVITDNEQQMISASFHSNCGGQTMNSEQVWSIATPYLKSLRDTFCQTMPNAKWLKRMPQNEWLDYLKEKFSYDISGQGALDAVLAFQQNERKEFLAHHIPLKTIRSDLNMRSTFFEISVDGNDVVFEGRGYGHGVGLCQEGAIKMAELGYSYTDIIHYYYQNVDIVNYHNLPYLIEEFRSQKNHSSF